jgi:hypothetical protein
VYDQVREPEYFCIEIQMIPGVGYGQLYSLETELYLLAHVLTAIEFTRCWKQFFYIIEEFNLLRLIKIEAQHTTTINPINLNNADNEISSGIPNLIMDKVIPVIGIIIPK